MRDAPSGEAARIMYLLMNELPIGERGRHTTRAARATTCIMDNQMRGRYIERENVWHMSTCSACCLTRARG